LKIDIFLFLVKTKEYIHEILRFESVMRRRIIVMNSSNKEGGSMSKSKDIRKSDKKKPQKTVKEKKQEKIEKNKNKA